MLVNSIRIFRLNRILDFKVLFCGGRKLLRKAFSLRRQLFLHFFQFVQITVKALVDAETFWTVQERIKVKLPGKKRSENNIFRGIMFCGECGKRMAFCSRKKDERRKSLGSFSRNANRRYGGKVCTTHYISLEQVKAIVVADIRHHDMLVAEDADA